MFVLALTQEDAARAGDRVPELLTALDVLGLRLPPERTRGPEVLALADRSEHALDAIRTAAELGGWDIGLGVGTVEAPLPSSVRELRGPAVDAALDAASAARRTSEVSIAVLAADPRHRETAADAQAVLRLVGWMIRSRSAGQWRTVTALREDPDRTQAQLAQHLGVTQQTVSRALKTSGWREESAAHGLVNRLLAMIDLTS